MVPVIDTDKADALNAYQRKLADQFDGGLHNAVLTAKHWRLYIRDSGDLLFRYLMLELSTVEGCATVKHVRERIQASIDRLELALGVFMPTGRVKR